MKTISLRWIWSVILVALLPILVSAQTQKRTIAWSIYRAPAASDLAPVEIVDIKAEGESVRIGQPFLAKDEWLKGLRFRVKNISGVPIRDLWMAVTFPETTRASGTLALSLFNPELHKLARSRDPKALMPGEEIDLILTEGQYQVLRKLRDYGSQIPSLTRVLIRQNIVVRFENAAEVFCSFRHTSP